MPKCKMKLLRVLLRNKIAILIRSSTYFTKLFYWFHHESIIGSSKRQYGVRLAKEFDFTVIDGPYRGMRIIEDLNWNKGDLSSIILGTYEKQVAKFIVESNFDCFVNFGSGDGIHLVGTALNHSRAKCIGYEQDIDSRNLSKKLSNLNRVEVEVRGKIDKNSLLLLLSEISGMKTVFLVDIEGYEYTLFDKEMLQLMKLHTIVIELHEFSKYEIEKSGELIEMSRNIFNIRFFSSRQFPETLNPVLDHYPDDIALLMLSESRPTQMRYLILQPKEQTTNAEC